MSHTALSQAALDQLFFNARTHNAWQERAVPVELLHQLYAAMRMGPTAVNSCPARLVFVTSPEAKAKLAPALMEGNRAKTLSAPVTVIIGYDLHFYEQLGQLFPHLPEAVNWFNQDPVGTEVAALRNGSLQGAYLMLAARALGLDCGPMSGFDAAQVEQAFFAGTSICANFLCNLGYGDPAGLYPRSPRLAFAEACQIV